MLEGSSPAPKAPLPKGAVAAVGGDCLKSQAAVMASALMELESLSADQVARVMNMLDSMGLTGQPPHTGGAQLVKNS